MYLVDCVYSYAMNQSLFWVDGAQKISKIPFENCVVRAAFNLNIPASCAKA